MHPFAWTSWVRPRAGHSRAAGRLLLLLAAFSSTACGRPDAVRGDRAALAATVDSLVAEYRDVTFAPGVSVAVVRGGRDTLVFRGYGYANVEHDVPATAETVYRIGSITKQFTAAAVLRLAERGRLSLDDPIRRHLPLLPPAWNEVRVRHLLNHTAGIPDVPPELYQEGMNEAALTPDSVIGLVRRGPLQFAPGTQWRYSNVGYTVLGRLIERLTGEPYGEHLESSLLRPLGLHATRYCHPTPLVRHRAAGYDQRDTGVVNTAHLTMTAAYAAGALCSTVGDVAAWNHALATGRVMSAEWWARMTTPDPGARERGYGYGLFVDTIAGRRMIQHSGGIHGFRTANAYLPDDSLSVTVLTNIGWTTSSAPRSPRALRPKLPPRSGWWRMKPTTADGRFRHAGRVTRGRPTCAAWWATWSSAPPPRRRRKPPTPSPEAAWDAERIVVTTGTGMDRDGSVTQPDASRRVDQGTRAARILSPRHCSRAADSATPALWHSVRSICAPHRAQERAPPTRAPLKSQKKNHLHDFGRGVQRGAVHAAAPAVRQG